MKLRASPKKENHLHLLPKFNKGDFQEAEDIVWINKAIASYELQNMANKMIQEMLTFFDDLCAAHSLTV